MNLGINNMKLGIYQHYKGNFYNLLAIARNTEDLAEMAVYQSLYGDYGLWVRPLSMFQENLIIDGKNIKRFSFVKECLTKAPALRI